MSERHLELINHSGQLAEKWVKELGRDLKWEDSRATLRLLRATLHALRDWLQLPEAVQLGAQLPTLIRGLYYESWKLNSASVKPRGRDEFLIRVGIEMSPEIIGNIDVAVATVFKFLSQRISAGEIADVCAGLPADLRALWK
jgi:uncharacterized protein (DUF2267 family)